MTSSIPHPRASPTCRLGLGSGWIQGNAGSLGTPYPVGIMVDLDA